MRLRTLINYYRNIKIPNAVNLGQLWVKIYNLTLGGGIINLLSIAFSAFYQTELWQVLQNEWYLLIFLTPDKG